MIISQWSRPHTLVTLFLSRTPMLLLLFSFSSSTRQIFFPRFRYDILATKALFLPIYISLPSQAIFIVTWCHLYCDGHSVSSPPFFSQRQSLDTHHPFEGHARHEYPPPPPLVPPLQGCKGLWSYGYDNEYTPPTHQAVFPATFLHLRAVQVVTGGNSPRPLHPDVSYDQYTLPSSGCITDNLPYTRVG